LTPVIGAPPAKENLRSIVCVACRVGSVRHWFEHHCRAASTANAPDIIAAKTSPGSGRAAMLIAIADNPPEAGGELGLDDVVPHSAVPGPAGDRRGEG
jgi:hypothetical protein